MSVSQDDKELLRNEYGYIYLDRKEKMEHYSDYKWVCRLTPITIQNLQEPTIYKVELNFEEVSFIIVPASYLLCLTPEDVKKYKELQDIRRKYRYAGIPIYGGYIEDNDGEKSEYFDAAVVVFACDYMKAYYQKKMELISLSDLFSFGLRLIQPDNIQEKQGSDGEIYNRELFLYKEVGEDAKFINDNGLIVGSFSSTAFEDTIKTYFTLKKNNTQNKSFVFVESYINAPSLGVSDSWNRYIRKEIFFSDVSASPEILDVFEERRFKLV